MEILVAYDVATTTATGRRRLRQVAKICEGFGQRVQESVFECTLTDGQLELLEARLLDTISMSEDNLRLYRLLEPRDRYARTYGAGPRHDLHDPLLF